ncbi:hypothetical protein PFISCL1PPCAC_78, partial [Pristionchus fissidentatus]
TVPPYKRALLCGLQELLKMKLLFVLFAFVAIAVLAAPADKSELKEKRPAKSDKRAPLTKAQKKKMEANREKTDELKKKEAEEVKKREAKLSAEAKTVQALIKNIRHKQAGTKEDKKKKIHAVLEAAPKSVRVELKALHTPLKETRPAGKPAVKPLVSKKE